MLCELDAAFEKREGWDAAKRTKIDAIRGNLESGSSAQKIDSCIDLYEEYSSFNVDSACRYVALMLKEYDKLPTVQRQQFRSLVNLVAAQACIMVENLHEARYRLSQIDTLTLSRENMVDYLSIEIRLLQYERQSVWDHAQRCAQLSDRIKEASRRRIEISEKGSASHLRYRASSLRASKRFEEARVLYDSAYRAATDIHLRAKIAAEAASCYSNLGDDEMSERMLILAAQDDFRASVKEYTSLPRLAIKLYERGDVERANRYMRCAMSDILSANHNVRLVEYSASSEAIHNAFAETLASRRRIMVAMVVIVSIFAVVIMFVLLRLSRQARRIRRMNDDLRGVNEIISRRNEELLALNIQLKEVNLRLVDSNRIKEQYVSQFMDLCTSYISKLDSYRHALSRTVGVGGIDALMKELRSPRIAEQERKDFYKIFDESFLALFPKFIDQVNGLLIADAAFVLKSSSKLN
ncbi:MAG: hypothetical protein IJB08_00090, partial [Alistipes sp.]|nr:hypothetical protein [Alistipes sp.]